MGIGRDGDEGKEHLGIERSSMALGPEDSLMGHLSGAVRTIW